MSVTSSAPKSLQDDEKGRGNISVAGSTDAIAFLTSRWKVVEAASQNNAIPQQERPQIFKEKPVGTTGNNNPPSNPVNNPTSSTTIPSKSTSGGSSGTSTPAKGSPWTGGRRK